MTFIDLFLVFWMLVALWGWWNAVKWKKRAIQANDDLWYAHCNGYATALMDQGYEKGEAVSRAKQHFRENAER